MSTHYETVQQADVFRDFFKVEPLADLGPRDMWPRKPGCFIRAVAQAAPVAGTIDAPEQAVAPAAESAPVAVSATPEGSAPVKAPPVPVQRELVAAQWGLVPHWVKSASDAKLRAPKLVNARGETASTSQAFRDAWLNNQRCIVPIMAFYEDDYRSGKAVATRISRIDGQPMGVAGLWARWVSPEGEELLSYTMLTVNANSHALVHRYQHPGSEKRMISVLNEGAYDAWLTVRQDKAKEFMRQYPANWLAANPVERKEDKVPKGWLG